MVDIAAMRDKYQVLSRCTGVIFKPIYVDIASLCNEVERLTQERDALAAWIMADKED